MFGKTKNYRDCQSYSGDFDLIDKEFLFGTKKMNVMPYNLSCVSNSWVPVYFVRDQKSVH